MKTALKLSIFLLIFALCSCSVNTEKESVLPRNTANTAANLTKSARTNPIVNTIALRTITQGIGKPPLFMVSFDSENLAERKGWDGTVKGSGSSRHTPFHNFIVNQSGTILTELSPDDVAPGNPLIEVGSPIAGKKCVGRKLAAKYFFETKTDENGEIILPEDLEDGDYEIKIEIGAAGYIVFDMTISKEKIKEVDAPNMLVNQDGTIRNFYYEEDFQLHSDIAKELGVEQIVITKGYYRVGKSKWGNVNLKVKNGGVVTGTVVVSNGNLRLFEGTNPKGIDCKGFGIACFYNAETGIDKKDILYYVVKPIIEKDILVGVEISEGKKGLNDINMKKGIQENGIK